MDLRSWRKINGLTSTQLADLVGLAATTVCHYERGTRRPSTDVAQRIEAATNGEVTAAELLGLEKRMTEPTAVREESQTFTNASVSVPVPMQMLNDAQRYKLDAAAIVAKGGVEALRRALKQAFIEHNQAAIEWTRDYVREHGTLSQQLGMI